ncbi:ImmA/IrrE family metallo-endopeptidase [Mesorhizobium sp. L103C131B0]|uniref:ImmA/IrrE family metallo-endopeptidase n=1 Tax=Mesorhizobium sp. L103C131B0 TaxID=1287089 RepID=UPI0003CFEDF9|nr:ImmA/IrrE family metallo-endopeptidase [Mesorhizobium sp. L103C131B0]ESZ62704.1 hypothetical protein X729_11455 [Mesorhizobium sp. L103C131B0]
MNDRTDSFTPDWTHPPGSTIARIMDQHGMSLATFATHIDLPEPEADRLLIGETEIDESLAQRLSKAVGSSASFWLKLEHIYRADFERTVGRKTVEQQTWLAQFPVKDMVKFGWVPAPAKEDLAATLLHFFGVDDKVSWQARYGQDIAAVSFRTSPTYESRPGAVAVWLRWSELQSEFIPCALWNPALLKLKVTEMRALTRRKHPWQFIPLLQALCAECGVALVIAPAPTGCRASGATRFLSATKALIALTLRYKSDDHFWFTFFHEVGHLLLHGKDALFLEDGSEVAEKEEKEANEFAERTLIPLEFKGSLEKIRFRANDIIRLAVQIGISPGVLVGQLQHSGQLGRGQFNTLKRRYEWSQFDTKLSSK